MFSFDQFNVSLLNTIIYLHGSARLDFFFER